MTHFLTPSRLPQLALSILSAGLVAVFGWYNTLLIGLSRAEDRLEIVQFSRNFESYLSTLNLIEETDGTYTVNGLTAEWSAKLVEEKEEGKKEGQEKTRRKKPGGGR